MFGAKEPVKTPDLKIVKASGKVDIPVAFDSREQWPDCVNPILNQGKCGGCWSFASAGTLSDRLCINSNS